MYTFTLRGKKHTLPSLAECSDAYSRVRDALGLGASSLRSAPLFLDGIQVGHIAYNGRIFVGTAKDWTPTTPLLYDNRA